MDIGIIGGVITQDAFKSCVDRPLVLARSSMSLTPNRAFGFSQLGTAAGDKADANLGANIVSVMQAGAFFGALFAYPVADKSVYTTPLSRLALEFGSRTLTPVQAWTQT